jgi:oxygen-independent coproporphyrinogen-3 oxidase
MHVYVHVPFCARRCTYCDFAIAVRRQVPSEAYVSAVLREWALWQREPAWDMSPGIETIYLGGGTPSRLDPGAVAGLLEGLARDRRVDSDAEITLEANPEDVTPFAAAAWKAAGVNRVSLGVQSFDPAVLLWMHRTHTASEVEPAVEAIRRAGISGISLDLIFGLPAELERSWEQDLERAFDLQPEHLSLYGLTVEQGTPLARQASRGQVTPVDENRYAQEFLTAHGALISRGYLHYEVSNAARPGHHARHNSAYWQRRAYLGLGPSAHSGFGSERRWNIRDWAAYQRALEQGCSPTAGRELLDEGSVGLEELYLGLRTTEGLPAHRVPGRSLSRWESAGWATAESNRVRLTAEGWLRLDALVASMGSALDSSHAVRAAE